nr:ATP-dependent DNA helicase PIF1-like [Tanacetum cinerariifolium]
MCLSVWLQTWHLLEGDVQFKQKQILKRPDLVVSDEEKKNVALFYIEKLMRSRGTTLRHWPEMPYPDERYISEIGNRLIYDELDYYPAELQSEYERLNVSLNTKQKSVYDTIMNSVETGQGGVYFVYGYGCTRKTFLWKTLATSIRRKGDILLNAASNGIASLLMSGGRTARSRFHISIHIDETSTCFICPQSDLRALLKKCKLIIWDEAPMTNKLCFKALDQTLRDVLRRTRYETCETPFGNMTMVFGGDFRQVIPVIRKGSRQDYVNASLKKSYLWDYCKVLKLTTNMRLTVGASPEDVCEIRDFAEWILKVGDGELGEANDGEVSIDVPEELLIDAVDDPITSIIDFTQPNRIDKTKRGSAIDEAVFSPKFINGLKFSGVPNHRVALKEKIINGTHFGNEVIIPRLRITLSDKHLPIKIVRKQYPLSLLFAMTTKKSQGQSFSKVGLCLPRPVFTHGKVYVALSRVKSKRGLKVVVCDEEGFQGRNILILLQDNSLLIKTIKARDRYNKDNEHNIRIKSVAKRGRDGRTYNLPTSNEVAGLIVGNFDTCIEQKDIVIEKHREGLERINSFHSLYVSLQYPLLMSCGQDGTVVFPSSEKQLKLRCDTYSNIRSSIAAGNTDPAVLGKPVVLPSSFTGGPRYMRQNYMDAMALCRCATLTLNGATKRDQSSICLNTYLRVRRRGGYLVLKFNIEHRLLPSVERLSFHLPGKQQVLYDENSDLETVLHKPSVGHSMFEGWMKMNELYPAAMELT